MPLLEITFLKDKKLHSEIVFNPTTQYEIDPKKYSFFMVRVFKYEFKIGTPLEEIKKKTHPKTTPEDIEWVFPKEPIEYFQVKSDSDEDKEYTIRKRGDKYTCTCPRYKTLWNKKLGCKHIKKFKNEK